jgi:hypothetical protein
MRGARESTSRRRHHLEYLFSRPTFAYSKHFCRAHVLINRVEIQNWITTKKQTSVRHLTKQVVFFIKVDSDQGTATEDFILFCVQASGNFSGIGVQKDFVA